MKDWFNKILNWIKEKVLDEKTAMLFGIAALRAGNAMSKDSYIIPVYGLLEMLGIFILLMGIYSLVYGFGAHIAISVYKYTIEKVYNDENSTVIDKIIANIKMVGAFMVLGTLAYLLKEQFG